MAWAWEFSSAVEDAGAFGDGECAGDADVGDAAIADDDDGVGKVASGVAPASDVDDGAASEDEGGGAGLWRGLRRSGKGGEGCGYQI